MVDVYAGAVGISSSWHGKVGMVDAYVGAV